MKHKATATYSVYMLQCEDGSLYTGITTDVKRRFAEHKAGRGGHYTSAHGAKRMVHAEKHPNRSAALKREAEIKKWSRAKKWELIKQTMKQKEKGKPELPL